MANPTSNSLSDSWLRFNFDSTELQHKEPFQSPRRWCIKSIHHMMHNNLHRKTGLACVIIYNGPWGPWNSSKLRVSKSISTIHWVLAECLAWQSAAWTHQRKPCEYAPVSRVNPAQTTPYGHHLSVPPKWHPWWQIRQTLPEIEVAHLQPLKNEPPSYWVHPTQIKTNS